MYMISGIYSSATLNAGRNSSGIICQGKVRRVAIAHGTSEQRRLLGNKLPDKARRMGLSLPLTPPLRRVLSVGRIALCVLLCHSLALMLGVLEPLAGAGVGPRGPEGSPGCRDPLLWFKVSHDGDGVVSSLV